MDFPPLSNHPPAAVVKGPLAAADTSASSRSTPTDGLGLSRAATARQLSETPPGQALVVNANLMEVFPNHLGVPQEMQTFVDRLLAKVSHMPDALLLSEVNSDSAHRVARLLSEATGQRFAVVADPGNTLITPDGAKHDTAIILNLDTMRSVGESGFLRMDTSEAEKSPDLPRAENKTTAYAHARERDGGMRLSLASLHLSHNHEMASDALAEKKKAGWMDQIASKLGRGHGGRRHFGFISGDFNAGKYAGQEAKPFLRTITEQHGYHDALADAKRGIDHMFSQAPVLEAYDDKTAYDQKAARLDGTFYSDHAFQWALVGEPAPGSPDRSDRPKPFKPDPGLVDRLLDFLGSL